MSTKTDNNKPDPIEKTNMNAFKTVAKDSKFVQEVLKDVTAINLTEQEVTKLKVFLRYETKGTLFDNISQIYAIISANFTKPSRFIVIPFIDGRGSEHLNIQKI